MEQISSFDFKAENAVLLSHHYPVSLSFYAHYRIRSVPLRHSAGQRKQSAKKHAKDSLPIHRKTAHQATSSGATTPQTHQFTPLGAGRAGGEGQARHNQQSVRDSLPKEVQAYLPSNQAARRPSPIRRPAWYLAVNEQRALFWICAATGKGVKSSYLEAPNEFSRESILEFSMKYSRLAVTALLLAGAVPAVLNAQFQQPTTDELNMTADPKAPGAAAVYLYREEVTDDMLHYHSVYARIKVLTEKGKELATVQLPYLSGATKIDDIKARTIHSDGTIIPLQGKPEDLLAEKSGDRTISRKVFNLPSVEVGSILEYRYQIRYDDNRYSSPHWEVQQKYFVHKAHYAFTPFKAFLKGNQNETSHYLIDEDGNAANTLIWWHILPPGADVKTDAVGRFSVDVIDVPAIPDEEWMPPIQSLFYQVLFYYKSSRNSGEFWLDAAKRWSKEVNEFAEPTKQIRDAADGLVSSGDSDLEKAKKLYKGVQALDNTDFSREKGVSERKQLKLKAAKRAEDTWAQKSGSSEDIALLYLALLRAEGLQAYAMKVVDRDEGIFAPGYLNFHQLDDNIILLNNGGKEILLDPGEKMCPFQTVHWRHSSAGGVRQSAGGPGAATSPLQPYTANTLMRTADLTVDSQGGIDGTIRFALKGQEALRWRQEAVKNDEAEVKKLFDKWIATMVPEGVEAHVDHFLALDDPESNLLVVIKVQGAIGSVTSKRLIIPGLFFETRSHHPFVDQEKRQEPVDMHYGSLTNDEVVYHLPAELSVESTPQDTKIPWEGHAVFVVKSQAEAGQITIARSLARAFTFAKAEEYQSLRDFYQKVAAADQQQLVLTMLPEQLRHPQ